MLGAVKTVLSSLTLGNGGGGREEDNEKKKNVF
jgi:hypothetical protein